MWPPALLIVCKFETNDDIDLKSAMKSFWWAVRKQGLAQSRFSPCARINLDALFSQTLTRDLQYLLSRTFVVSSLNVFIVKNGLCLKINRGKIFMNYSFNFTWFCLVWRCGTSPYIRVRLCRAGFKQQLGLMLIYEGKFVRQNVEVDTN